MRLDDVRGFVLDVDGTLVHRAGEETHVQPGAREVLARIRASGRPLAVFTNGSYAAPEAFAAGLREVGLEVADEELLTPLRSVQSYLRAHHRDGGVLLFGNDAARDFLLGAGVRILSGKEGEHADAVFVATPDSVDFEELERAARAVLAGARLLTGSYAPAYAGANGPIFSRGAMVAAALGKATGARPVIVGKPSRAALQTISERLGAPTAELAVIGDDLGMDIALGRLGGSRTILVRSGISGPIDLERVPERRRPDAIVDGVAELLAWL
ncbi:MAG TPA: HAD hydrolase-like protein [Gaiellaceae bacterium]|nr:HAD hydrolase-like protein [Gaiellaceae bacterium]